MKRVGKAVLAMGMVMVSIVGLMAVSPSMAFAANEKKECPSIYGANKTYTNSVAECSTQDGDEPNGGLWNTINIIINVVLGLAGIIAVIMIIFGGFKIATSAGAADKVKSGKDTIMYGVIGLIIALLAFAIVNFVLNSVFGGTKNGSTTYSSKSACEKANDSCTCAQNSDKKWYCK
ncbi:hypothetical protein IJ096_02255 [Candidatus Saccharibacteria bacterium]|nr:hypothetical protein [Candidatus Saccharibacteria bacterium]